jgi:hypothetical protein
MSDEKQVGLHNFDQGEGERDECPDCGEGVMPAEDIADEVCTTQSINSPVIGADGPVDLHVMLLDYDEKDPSMTCEVIDDVPGISVVLESSDGSCHVWSLTARPVEETVCEMVMLRNELAHIRSGLNRGYWRLRIGPKVRNGGDTYKEPPELRSVVVNETSRPQSRPHWKLARSLYDLPDLPPTKHFEWVGEDLSTEKYATLTDEAKGAWPNGG